MPTPKKVKKSTLANNKAAKLERIEVKNTHARRAARLSSLRNDSASKGLVFTKARSANKHNQ
jgi:hypothetical protein